MIVVRTFLDELHRGGGGVTGNNTCKISFAPLKGSKYLYTAIFTFLLRGKGKKAGKKFQNGRKR